MPQPEHEHLYRELAAPGALAVSPAMERVLDRHDALLWRTIG
jgi:hypothetical protein